jgi:hypothetical protein
MHHGRWHSFFAPSIATFLRTDASKFHKLEALSTTRFLGLWTGAKIDSMQLTSYLEALRLILVPAMTIAFREALLRSIREEDKFYHITAQHLAR